MKYLIILIFACFTLPLQAQSVSMHITVTKDKVTVLYSNVPINTIKLQPIVAAGLEKPRAKTANKKKK